MDFHIHNWDFSSMKSEITKNSTRIANVMEKICTLLQCKVNLSMFHSSPTSKICTHVPNMMCTMVVQKLKVP
jgi:hypothetical protein